MAWTPTIARLIDRYDLTPTLRRYQFVVGEGYIPLACGDEAVAFYFSRQGRQALETRPSTHPQAFGGWEVAEPELLSGARNYTVRRFDEDTRMMTVDVALHGAGPAMEWFERAESGDEVLMAGPRSWYSPPTTARRHLLLGDTCALPAMARIIEDTPAIRGERDLSAGSPGRVAQSAGSIARADNPGIDSTGGSGGTGGTGGVSGVGGTDGIDNTDGADGIDLTVLAAVDDPADADYLSDALARHPAARLIVVDNGPLTLSRALSTILSEGYAEGASVSSGGEASSQCAPRSASQSPASPLAPSVSPSASRPYCWFCAEAADTRAGKKELRRYGWMRCDYDIIGYWRQETTTEE